MTGVQTCALPIFDAHTGEVVAQTLTAAGTDDASQVRPMLEQTPGEIGRFYGDGAYDRWKVHRLLAYPPKPRAAPIEAVIPPQRNATQRIAKRRYRHIEARNERVQSILHMGRKRWKRDRGYHKLSLAETGMARYKRILGPQLRRGHCWGDLLLGIPVDLLIFSCYFFECKTHSKGDSYESLHYTQWLCCTKSLDFSRLLK